MFGIGHKDTADWGGLGMSLLLTSADRLNTGKGPGGIGRVQILQCLNLMKPTLQVVSILISLWIPKSDACIWQDGDEPYWPSNEIEVCFLSQEKNFTSDPSLVRNYNEARSSIQKVI